MRMIYRFVSGFKLIPVEVSNTLFLLSKIWMEINRDEIEIEKKKWKNKKGRFIDSRG